LKPGSLSLGLLLALVATGAVAQSSETSERRFTLPDHGYLVIQVPREWKAGVGQRANHLPPTIAFGPRSGKPFQVLVTPVWPPKGREPQSPDEVRAAVERGAQGVRAQAVERELPIRELRGRSGPGFYFSATDRAPRPGEYKFLTQGIIRTGELSVAFTILTNEGHEAVVKQALEALRSAAQDGV